MISDLKLDPRTKIAVVAILSTLAIVFNNLFLLSIVFIVSLLTALLMSNEVMYVVSRLRKLIWVVVAIALVQSVFTRSGSPIFEVGDLIVITDYGILMAVEFMLRMGIIAASSLILASSTSREMVQGMIQLKIPYEIAFMVSVAIRFLPIFRDEMIDMVNAIQLRGLDIKRIGIRKKIKAYSYLLLPITVNSIVKAKELSVAMESRAFRAYPERTSYTVLKFTGQDFAVLSISILFAAAAVFFAVRID